MDKKITTIINREGAGVIIVRNWLKESKATNLLNQLKDGPKWLCEKTPFGTDAKSRRIFAIGDNGLVHRYSKQVLPLTGWNKEKDEKSYGEILQEILIKINKIIDSPNKQLNACLLNEYKDGSNYLGFHSDREALGYNNYVAALSLGGSRDIVFKRKDSYDLLIYNIIKIYCKKKKPCDIILGYIEDTSKYKIQLNNGDLMFMFGTCQEIWQHSIPKRAHADYRISVTYRCITEKSK